MALCFCTIVKMKGLETISHSGKVLALIFRKNIKVNDLQFFTDDESPLQVGFHNRKKGIKLTPHVHEMKKPSTIKSIQEVLYIEKGKIRLTLYTPKGNVVAIKILAKGDSVLLISGGHGVDFLQKTRIFQVKQGPYSNTVHAKLYLKS